MSNKQQVIQPDLKSFSKEGLINAIFVTAQEEGLPLACWKNPHSSEFNLILSFSSTIKSKHFEIQDLEAGFLFAPFDYGEKKAQFIRADVQFSFDFDETIVKVKEEPAIQEKYQHISRKIFEYAQSDNLPCPLPSSILKEQTTIDYKKLVEKSIEAIKDGFFEKVVPARCKDVELTQGFNLQHFIAELGSNYPNAFVSYTAIPSVGHWIGATPEILIHRKKNTFNTVALAATQKFNSEQAITDTAWTQKEIEEQAMVSRYIINCFKKIRLRDFKEKGPETIKAGNLLHLKTTFEVDMESTNFHELPSVMLELLHPTSAVAGMPREQALAFLKTEEGLDRSFYSGFLGPVNLEDETRLFVNLRCMEISRNSARLYAGAGVTEFSNPQKEFEETEMKFNTLLNILNQSH